MKSVLIVEDDRALGDGLCLALKSPELDLTLCRTLAAARAALAAGNFGLLILDVNLPDGNGLDLLREIRRTSGVSVILLTANDLEMDIVAGLECGADDYVTKPFSPSELVARVDAVYRRVSMSSSAREDNRPILSGCFVLSPKSRTLTKNGEPVDLTQVEYQIMEYFIKNKNVALERSRILEHIWGDSYNGDVKIVDVNIRRLRMKIEDEPSKPVYIQTIWGYGYKWQEPV